MSEQFQIDFNTPIHLHFIGIGGISMSGLAEVLLSAGFSVSGSDTTPSELTDRLSEKGARIAFPQAAENITDDIDAVIYSAAIHPDNPEYMAAVRAGLPMIGRADLLGQLMDNYPTSIAVAGTHGKTTTTSMIAHILIAAGTDPTISVGGILPAINGNIRVGAANTFLTEACEYTNSFLSLHPTVGIILNIDADHLDFFKDLDDIYHSFRLFAEGIQSGGTLVIDADLPRCREIIDGLDCSVLTCSQSAGSDADCVASDLRYDNTGCASFSCTFRGQAMGDITLGVPGAHNVSNALAAIASACAIGVDPESIRQGLAEFTGTDRRFQYKGVWNGVTVIDDYAHHPTEIRATLETLQNVPHETTWCIFQPHTFTRTKALLDEFVDALSGVDELILAKIYAARETDDLGISSRTISDAVAARGHSARSFEDFDEIEAFLRRSCRPGDVVLTMGAGDVYKIGEALLADA